jgi:hypothetical protein
MRVSYYDDATSTSELPKTFSSRLTVHAFLCEQSYADRRSYSMGTMLRYQRKDKNITTNYDMYANGCALLLACFTVFHSAYVTVRRTCI